MATFLTPPFIPPNINSSLDLSLFNFHQEIQFICSITIMQRSIMDFLPLLIFSIKTNAQQQTPFLYPFISGGYSFLIVTRASNLRPRSRVARFHPRKFHEIDGKRF
jgi:hypothetical protein